MARKERHIVPNSERGDWDSKRENAERASKHFETKKEAIDWSRPKAKQEGSELIPHGKDGKIQNPNSYGKDPFRQKIKSNNYDRIGTTAYSSATSQSYCRE